MKIAVTGGTGFIGSHLIENLLAKGHEVSCLVLPHESHRWLKGKNVQFITGNILQKESLRDFVRGKEIIIHLAGLTRAHYDHEYFTVNAQGTRNILEALAEYNPGIRQFIAMSSQAAVGPSPGHSYISEEVPLNPISPYGKSKAEVERTLKEHDKKIPYTIVRAPAVYGPRDRDFVSVFKIIKLGFKPIIGNNKLSFVYVKNLVHGIERMIGNPAALNNVYFISDDGARTWREFGTLVEKALKRRAIAVIVPEGFVDLVAMVYEVKARFTKEPLLLSKYKILEMKQPFWMISNEKAKKELGYDPPFTTETAIQDCASWYTSQPWV